MLITYRNNGEVAAKQMEPDPPLRETGPGALSGYLLGLGLSEFRKGKMIALVWTMLIACPHSV